MKGWRPLLRIARRDALRHKGRSLLIAAMVALPVAAMSTSLTLGRSVERTPEQSVSDTMGQADLQVGSSGVPPAEWQALLPEGSRATPVREDYGDVAVVLGDELFEPSLFVADLADPLVAGMAELVSGRAASHPGEVVVSTSLVDELGVDVERLALARPDRTVTVVGTALQPFAVNLLAFFVPPDWTGDGARPTSDGHLVRWLVDVGAADPAGVEEALRERFSPSPFPTSAPAGVTAFVPEGEFDGFEDADYFEVFTRASLLAWSAEGPNNDEVSVTYVAGTLALVWTGGVAAAAFAVGARRRLREVGLVAATGGDPRHLRHMLLADGLVLGLAGALSGVVLGLALAAVARPHLDRLVGYAVDDLRIPLALLFGAAATGCVAAVLAALVPARSASRVPVVAALAGRPAGARTRSWLAVGVVALVVGVALAWQGGGNGSEAAVNAGVLLVVVGVAATTAPLLVLVARIAGAAPLALRLAARDAGRARSRTGPATVAAMLGLAGAVGGAAMFQSYEAQAQREHVALLRDDQLSVRFTEARPAEAEVDAVLAAAVGAVPGAEGALLSAVTLGADGLEVFSGPDVPDLGTGNDLGAGVANGPQPGSVVAVGDVTALGVMGGSEAVDAFEAGQVIALNGGTVGDGGTVTLRTIDEGELNEVSTVPAVEVEGEPLHGVPNYLMSAATAESLVLAVHPSSIVLRAPEAVTDSDVRRVNLAVLDATPAVPVFTARESPQGAGALVLPVMLGAGALVALFVVALVTALSREELRPHLATLAAAGAAPRTRRRLAAAQSGLLAGLAAVLAVPAGLIPAVTLLRARAADVEVSGSAFVSSLSSPPVVVPWLAIAALVVGVTLISAAGGGLFTRSRGRTT